MRYYSKQLDSIKAQAVAKLGRRLTDMENARGFTLQDSRPTIDRARAMGRKAVPAAPESWADRERAKLAREKREAKLAKLPRNERLLAYLDEMAEREVKSEGEHPRLEAVLVMRDRIKFDPSREQAALDLAILAVEQHGAGMNEDVADELYEELLVQEQLHIAGLKASKVQRQQELLAELAALDADAARLPSDENRWNLVQAMIQHGPGLPAAEFEAVKAADTPEARSAVVARLAPQIAAYEATLGDAA
jgi:hypothetical protein